MGRFIIGHGDDGKAIYQYVYGSNNDEALKKVQIGMEVESRICVCSKAMMISICFREAGKS